MAEYAPFFYIYATAIALLEVLLGVVFAVRARVQSSRRIAYLGMAYAWSAPLTLGNVLALPGVSPMYRPALHQVAPSLWILWHVGWAVAIGAYAFAAERRETRASRFVAPTLFAALVAGGLTYAFSRALPELLDARDALQPPFLAAIAVAGIADSIMAVRLFVRRTASRDLWVAASATLATIDAICMFSSDVRFSALYMAARIAGFSSALAMIGALASDTIAVLRRTALESRERARLEEFRFIADAMPQIVWQISADGRRVDANARWSEYTGRSSTTGEYPDDFASAIHPDDRDAHASAFGAALERGTSYESTDRLQAADGSYRYFLTRAIPIVREGRTTGWVATSTDVDASVREQGRMRSLAAMGRSLAESLDLDVVLRTAAAIAVPEMADWAIVQLFDDAGKLVVAAVHHRDPERAAAMQEIVGASYVEPAAKGASAEAAETARGVCNPDLTEETLARVVRPEWLDFMRSFSPRSSAIVPLFVRGEVRGTLGLVYAESGRHYAPADLEALEEIGRRVALAIDHAEIFAREHRVADRLQRASLPATLPARAGVLLDAIYQAGNSEAQIGGDWYDAFELEDGRLVIGVGDVIGSGLEAAVTMGAVRQSIRGAAEVFADPVTILDAADRALAKHQPDRIVTAFLGILDPESGLMTYASAGHPPPFLRSRDGTIVELEGSSLPIGLRRERLNAVESSHSISLEDDALLVLYTDGLTEAGRDVIAGEAQLRASLQAVESDRPAVELRERMLGAGTGTGSRDDVAILTLRLTPARNENERTFRCDVGDGAHVATVRREIVRELRERGLRPDSLFDAELALGELLGNVARHAGGIADVTLRVVEGAAELRVADRGPGFEPPAELARADAARESGRGLYIVASLVRRLSVVARPGGGSDVRALLYGPLQRVAPALDDGRIVRATS